MLESGQAYDEADQNHRRKARRWLCGIPSWLKGVVVGDGNSYEEALADVKSAIAFHFETFGAEVLDDDSALLEAFVAEASFPT